MPRVDLRQLDHEVRDAPARELPEEDTGEERERDGHLPADLPPVQRVARAAREDVRGLPETVRPLDEAAEHHRGEQAPSCR